MLAALFTQATICAAQETIEVPSGLGLTLQEVLVDDSIPGGLYRFRFVAPEISASSGDGEQLLADLEYLCQAYALEKMAEIRAEPSRIIISVASEPTEFGVATPDVRQVFESFAIEENTCIWEAF